MYYLTYIVGDQSRFKPRSPLSFFGWYQKKSGSLFSSSDKFLQKLLAHILNAILPSHICGFESLLFHSVLE